MQRRARIRPEMSTTVHPAGATLTEVLMSLLIMSIGIVSVFTLYPISILQSIRATQLTNARLLEDNIRNILPMQPGLTLGVSPPAVVNWQSEEMLPSPQVVVVPSGGTPRKTFRRRPDESSADRFSDSEPNWNSLANLGGFWGIIEEVRDEDDMLIGQNVWEPAPLVVDPLGWHYLQDQGSGSSFGNQNGELPSFSQRVIRSAASFGQFQSAQRWFTLPDSWSTVAEAVPLVVDNSERSVTFPSGNDVDVNELGVTTDGRVRHRLVFADRDRRRSAIRNIDVAESISVQQDNPNGLIWGGDQLPLHMRQTGEISTVRIEVFSPKYSWLVSIPASPQGISQPQHVVIFNRQFSLTAEHLYEYSVNSGTGRTQLQVTWDSSDPTPLIRENNYLFDANSGTWIRMIDVSINLSAQQATITLNNPLPVVTPEPSPSGFAMFMPGVVQVF